MIFECMRCGYTTNRRSSYASHLARASPCPPKRSKVDVSDLRDVFEGRKSAIDIAPAAQPKVAAKPTCEDCGAVFAHRQSKYAHIKFNRCRKKINLAEQVENLETKLAEQGETILKQQMQIKQLRERKVEKKSIKNYISYHTNNYTMNSYGSEHKTQTISTETYAKLCSKPYSAVCGLIREKHFNPEHPENHNVAITNANGSTCHVVDNGAFVLRNKGELANDMCFKNFDELHTAFREGVRELLEPFNRRSWMKFEEAWDSQPEVSHRIVEQVKLMCYNEPNKFTLA